MTEPLVCSRQHSKVKFRRFSSVMIATISLVLLLPACGSATDNTTRIQISNRSDYDFERVVVRFPNQTEDFGSVRSGEVTSYRAVGLAYRYATIEVTVQGRTITLQPIDYTGERPLPPGSFTYALAVDLENSRIELELVPGQLMLVRATA